MATRIAALEARQEALVAQLADTQNALEQVRRSQFGGEAPPGAAGDHEAEALAEDEKIFDTSRAKIAKTGIIAAVQCAPSVQANFCPCLLKTDMLA